MTQAIKRLRDVTRQTPYEGRLYLVGGLLRDRLLGLPASHDLDLVMEGDAVGLARFLHGRGLSRHFPVLYPRFGTAMLTLSNPDGSEVAVELVSARSESYHVDSRKPDVRQGTLREDVFRRDFTVNTLLENLHSGELQDMTGHALRDIESGILRTPLEPRLTFFDDPLRMLRAVRFAARFDFSIEPNTWEAILAESSRLRPPAIASERIRDEFCKIAKLPGSKFRRGMELLRESNLLSEFLPEMLPLVGCTQGAWHRYDVWTHTLTALEALPDMARLELRLGLLWHDIGKPRTRVETNDAKGVRFTGHAALGAEQTRDIMNRLKFSNEEIRDVTCLVEKHMRLGEYRPEWTDASVKRLIRDCGPYLADLFILTRCDQSAIDIPPVFRGYTEELQARIAEINALTNVLKIDSPLDGKEIMKLLALPPGPHLREAKDYLTGEIIEGRLAEGDREAARLLLVNWWSQREKGAQD